jgi:hypothetical protein
MEYLKLLVDLAKAIAWPSAVFALGYMFRSDVRALFPRLTKAGPTGFLIRRDNCSRSPPRN